MDKKDFVYGFVCTAGKITSIAMVWYYCFTLCVLQNNYIDALKYNEFFSVAVDFIDSDRKSF